MTQGLILIDHGSRRRQANLQLACMARLVQQQAGDAVYVRHAHMELAAPTLAEAFAACVHAGVEEIVIHPFFLAPGRHASEDIPRLAAEAAASFPQIPYRVSAPLGVHPWLGRLVLERCGLTLRGPDFVSAAPSPACPEDPAACTQPWCGPRAERAIAGEG